MLVSLDGLHFHKQFFSHAVGFFMAEHGPASFFTSYLDGVLASDYLMKTYFPI